MDKIKHIETDVLIIGGGTAGCYAAIVLGEYPIQVLVAEKANIERSGCLAAGVNALNAYIAKGHTPKDYVEYARSDANGIVRDDLLITMSEGLNRVTEDLKKRGLVILQNENGEYVTRGWRNIKINGENIKPLLAKGVKEQKNVSVLNGINITDLILNEEKCVIGAWGFFIEDKTVCRITAPFVLMATGGASGLYMPNNPSFSRHKMWYSPFNTGAGYAMGLRAGAELTTLEHRFVALRCKDTIAPTGTIAQGVGAKQVNAKGEVYENFYELTTPGRIYGTVEEKIKGNGPCYLKTSGISKEQEEDLFRAYLNMAPAQTLRWIESGRNPSMFDTEIEGTEPYVVGGHTASGFWVDTNRRTTVKGLFAAGDVAGGAPQKYVTGAMVEGEIAAKSIWNDFKTGDFRKHIAKNQGAGQEHQMQEISPYAKFFQNQGGIDIDSLEEEMQKVMDEYAGGISSDYRYSEEMLNIADEKISDIEKISEGLFAENGYALMKIYELKERLTVCRALIAHLKARRETRWHIFGENADYPEKNEEYLCYINSYMEDGKVKTLRRELVKEDFYEHTH